MKFSLETAAFTLLLFFAAVFLLQLTDVAVQKNAARAYYDSVLNALEDSFGEPAVAEDCCRKAAEAGYTLTVTPVLSSGIARMCLVELEYGLHLPLFGDVSLGKGTISGYAR